MGVFSRIWILLVVTACAYAQTTDDYDYKHTTEGTSTAFDITLEVTEYALESQTQKPDLNADDGQATQEKDPDRQCIGRSTVSATSGELMTPNYPNRYPNNVTCMWTIQAPKDRHIYLYFNHFHLEEGLNIPAFHSYVAPDCRFDMLYIAEEVDVTNPQAHQSNANANVKSNRSVKRTNWGMFCGTSGPPSRMTSTPGSRLILVFHADSSRTETGFWASYQTLEAAPTNNNHAKAGRKVTPTRKKVSVFDKSFWEGDQEDTRKAYAAVILFIFSICLILMVLHCWQGSGGCSRNCRRRPRVSSSVPSILMNMFGRTDQDEDEQRRPPSPSPPPAYGDIVKTEEDWHLALERIGETEESIERYRSLPDNIIVEYDIAGDDSERDECLNTLSTLTSASSDSLTNSMIESSSSNHSSREESLPTPSTAASLTSNVFPVPIDPADGEDDDYFDEEEMLRHLPRVLTICYGPDENGYIARNDTEIIWN